VNGETLGSGMSLLASGAQTGGRFEVFRMSQDGAGGPPLHVHHERDEGFYVLRGALVLTLGDTKVDAPTGSFVLVPAGTPHTFEAREGGVEFLVLVAPAGLEGYLRALGAGLASGGDAVDLRTALSSTHDSHPVTS
jgi:mannose-6-phosphate isomerase-like protein (cupin superfamily)